MSNENGGANPQESGGQPETNANDKVAYETYRRVLAEAKKLKEQLKAVEDERSKSQEQKLREQNEWKALAESKASKVQELESILKEQNDQIVNGMKYQEFEKHLGGRLRSKDYATFIEFDKIAINPETKSVDPESVKAVAASFVKSHPHLVEFQTGKMPNEAGSSATVAKDYSQMSTLDIANEIKKLGSLT